MKTKQLHLFEYNCISYLLIRGAFIGICLNNLMIISKQDSWISILLAIVLGFIPLIIYYFIINSNSKEDVSLFIKKTCGPILGTIINIILILFIFLFTSIVFWDLISFISSQYLYKTPNLAISITFAIALYYIASKSINVIGRSAVIFVYISVFLYLCSFFGLLLQVDFTNVKPIFEHGFKSIFNGSMHYMAYNILPLFIMTIIPKDMISNNKSFAKNSLITYIVASISLFTVCFFLLSIYGIQISTILQYPAFHLLKRLSLIGFIQRVENILSIQWILDMFMFIVMGVYYIKTALKNNFNIKEYKITTFVLIILLIICTNFLFKNNTIGNVFIIKYFPFIIFLFFLILPAFIFMINKLKKNST